MTKEEALEKALLLRSVEVHVGSARITLICSATADNIKAAVEAGELEAAVAVGEKESNPVVLGYLRERIPGLGFTLSVQEGQPPSEWMVSGWTFDESKTPGRAGRAGSTQS